MCEHCRTSPHLPGCPNADEDFGEVVGACENCDRDIYESENRYRIPGDGLYCEDCMDSFKILGG